MKRHILSGLRAVDQLLATASLRCRTERPALLAFSFHCLFENDREIARDEVDAYQPLRVSDFRRFVEYFCEHGYRFVTPAQILGGLDPSGRYVWATFDDGYANNLRAQSVLREFQVPATVFISSNHVAEGKAFWWDALYRERCRRGTAPSALRREQAALKRRPYREIEAYLRAEFGAHALRPVGDTDRPMTSAELRQFAAEPLVTLGNHTADHAILTVLDDGEARAQVHEGQQALTTLTGVAPQVIAYPNGDYDSRVLQIVRAEGLQLGTIVEERKNRLPLTSDTAMTLVRHFVAGGPTITAQCERCRSDVRLLDPLRRMVRRRPSPA